MSEQTVVIFDEVQQHRFKAYVDTIKRIRWLILTTTILAILILSHVYLEQYGFQSRQLAGVQEFRIKTGRGLEALNAEHDSLVQLFRTQPVGVETNNALNERLKRYSTMRYAFDMTENTLRDLKIENQQLPLLGIAIPGNDYVPILAVMLAIMMISVWLHVRALDHIERELIKHNEHRLKNRLEFSTTLIDLIRLYFTFTTARDANGSSRGNRVAQLLQYAAFWLPPLALIIGSYVDLSPLLDSGERAMLYSGPSNAIALRIIILLISSVVVVSAAQSCTTGTLSLDKHVKETYDRLSDIDSKG